MLSRLKPYCLLLVLAACLSLGAHDHHSALHPDTTTDCLACHTISAPAPTVVDVPAPVLYLESVVDNELRSDHRPAILSLDSTRGPPTV